nr:MAG TPA: hypothetical protein [Caudoviricetes sp.]
MNVWIPQMESIFYILLTRINTSPPLAFHMMFL